MKKYLVRKSPFTVPAEGGKLIEEHHGLAATGDEAVSIARMVAPPHWSEPFQTPEFDEYTYIISGKKQFIIDGGPGHGRTGRSQTIVFEAGQSIKINKNTRVQYANPFEEPCEYIAICLPAFSIQKVNREG